MSKLARLDAHKANVDKITEYFSIATSKLAELADDELTEFYSLLSKVVGRAWKTECAVIYELVRRVSQRKEDRPHYIVAEMLGVSRSTIYSKEAIWRVFFQDPNVDYVSERPHDPYIFEDKSDGSGWFLEALKMPDPISAIRMAERRIKEYQSRGVRYTIRDFRLDLDAERSRQTLKDQHPIKEPNSPVECLKEGILAGDYRKNIRQAAFYIEKAITSIADEIVDLIDADGRILEKTATTLNVLVSDLRTIMFELRLMLGDATVQELEASINDRSCRLNESPIIGLIEEIMTKDEKVIDVSYEVEDEDSNNV